MFEREPGERYGPNGRDGQPEAAAPGKPGGHAGNAGKAGSSQRLKKEWFNICKDRIRTIWSMTNGIDSYSVPETARYVPEANGLTHDANSLIPDSFAPEVLQTHAEAETGLMSLYERLFGTN